MSHAGPLSLDLASRGRLHHLSQMPACAWSRLSTLDIAAAHKVGNAVPNCSLAKAKAGAHGKFARLAANWQFNWRRHPRGN